MLLKRIIFFAIIGLIFLNTFSLTAQDQRVADSLALIYKENKLEGEQKMELLVDLGFNELNDHDLSFQYTEELIALAKQADNKSFLRQGYYQRGNYYVRAGALEKALADYFLSAKIAMNLNDLAEGIAYMSVADVYVKMDNHDKGDLYFKKAIDILRTGNDSILLGSVLLNAGDAAFKNKKLDLALDYFDESGLIFKNIEYDIGMAYNLGNVGMVYAEQAKDFLAEQNINEAISILEEVKDYYAISIYLTYMSDIYLRKGNFNQALKYGEKSLELAKKNQLIEQISDASLKLSELYEQQGNYKKSNEYYKNHIVYRDSLKNISSIQQMADIRADFEISQNQKEADYEIAQKQIKLNLLEEKQKNQRITVTGTIIALVLIVILAVGLFRRNRFIQKNSALVEKEKERSDKLLLNILPEETALELKDSGKVTPKKFDSVTVMFTDFRAFTEYSKHLTPELLVKSVDYHFSKFDEIMDIYGLEKIKTIGDSYMCAGGLPFPCEDHAEKMINAAFEILEFIEKIKKDGVREISHFDIRIGIHTGPVVAGVVGTKKFAYDIWGDTVNIASRMESNSEPGRINISEATFKLINDKFGCEYRGEIQAKNTGMMKMYFANGSKNQINNLTKEVI